MLASRLHHIAVTLGVVRGRQVMRHHSLFSSRACFPSYHIQISLICLIKADAQIKEQRATVCDLEPSQYSHQVTHSSSGGSTKGQGERTTGQTKQVNPDTCAAPRVSQCIKTRRRRQEERKRRASFRWPCAPVASQQSSMPQVKTRSGHALVYNKSSTKSANGALLALPISLVCCIGGWRVQVITSRGRG